MVKKRVHELAKELNIESREIINRLKGMGVDVKSHMSTLEDNEVEAVIRHYSGSRQQADNKPQPQPRPDTRDNTREQRPAGGEVKRDPARSPAAGAKHPRQDDRNRGHGRDTGHRDDGRRDTHRYDRGPGLVDRVPSRPPDKRFTERQTGGGGRPAPFGAGAQGPAQGENEKGATTPQPRQGGYQGKGNRPRPDAASDRGPRDRVGQTGGQTQRPRQDAGNRGGYKGPGRGPGQHASGGAGQRTPGHTPRPGTAGPGQRPANNNQLKVPKVPQEAPGVDKVRTDKARGDKSRQHEKQRELGRQDNKRFNDGTDIKKLRSASGKRKGSKPRPEVRPQPQVEKKPVVMGESITVQELAEKMKKSPAELIKRLMTMGYMATINQEIDNETATILAGEFGFEVEIKIRLDAEQLLMQEPEDDPGNMELRPCVVTVMGHVDHGKTSLLDSIRKSNVTATEAGGITQHIGAYQVDHNNRKITFVDTPGHEAFTAMRARGAKVTDIAILVVAADDGVMPQTIEAINHAKAAKVPIIVAVNKIDKEGANPDRVKQQLTEYELIAEEWGGDTIFVPVSAITREGLEDLLEMILLVSEVIELKANPQREARGTVIEAELDKGRGPVATVLVQNGTLHVGDNIVAGTAFGRVRAMMDDKGRRLKKAGPSTPVQVLGYHEVPLAGDPFYVVTEEKVARQIAEKRVVRRREEDLKSTQGRISLDDLFKHIQQGQVKELPLIIKSDVQGSTEALKQSLERLSNEEVKVNIIHGGVGAISETDIMLASASNAIVIGFNVRPDINTRRAAENEKVDIRLYRVIYDAIEDVKAAMSGLLEPEYREVVLGRVEVRKTFKVSKVGTIAGCYVLEGKIIRDSGVRLIRDSVVVHEGKLDSLKRFKDDVKEVVQGYECGLTLDNFNDLHEGDIVEAFTTEAVKRELS